MFYNFCVKIKGTQAEKLKAPKSSSHNIMLSPLERKVAAANLPSIIVTKRSNITGYNMDLLEFLNLTVEDPVLTYPIPHYSPVL